MSMYNHILIVLIKELIISVVLELLSVVRDYFIPFLENTFF